MFKRSNIFFVVFFVFSYAIFSACTKPGGKESSKVQAEQIIHKANLPSGWYTQNAEELKNEINSYFTQAKSDFNLVTGTNPIKALIVPHAGHYYSGFCAACAYQVLLGKNGEKNGHISRVIVMCPSHRVFLNNIALPNYNVYQTCLGEIEVDTQAIKTLGKASPVFRTYADAHNLEHAIEVQLPFLQQTLSEFKLVPLIVGNLTPESFHDAVKALKKIVDDSTLVVVSSDFTHFGKNYEFVPFSKLIFYQIRYVDSLAIQSITSLSGYDFEQILQETKTTICGQIPINLFLGLAHMGAYKNISSNLACYYNSAQIKNAIKNNEINSDILLDPVADTDCDSCVSYASIVFTEQKEVLPRQDMLSEYEKKSLLKLARQTIENYFKPENQRIPQHLIYPILSSAIQSVCGAFVTLNTKNGDLRGCIGQILAKQPLYQIVSEMALAAAFSDSRFEPLKKEELDNVVIDITILTAPQKIDDYKNIQIGRHGIILKKLGVDGQVKASAVFLPQVPGQFGWDLVMTLEQLSKKAGLGKDDWQHDCEFEVFEGFEIKEK